MPPNSEGILMERGYQVWSGISSIIRDQGRETKNIYNIKLNIFLACMNKGYLKPLSARIDYLDTMGTWGSDWFQLAT